MNYTSRNLTLVIILVLLLCRLGAVAHAAEHAFEHEVEYCEICSLSDHQSDGLIKSSNFPGPNEYQSKLNPFSTSTFITKSAWNFFSRAPPLVS